MILLAAEDNSTKGRLRRTMRVRGESGGNAFRCQKAVSSAYIEPILWIYITRSIGCVGPTRIPR
jgi:hypothetical protein